jgi:TP901 family phage tail tape measure protein
MGETIRIEIPVSVNDNTDPGLSNITNKMNTLATAAQKVNRILSSGFKTRGIEQTAERVDRTLGREHSIEVSADDNATPVLSRVEDAAERVGGISADIEIGANDNATDEISGVEDAAATLDGTSVDVELGADDNASPIIDDVRDKAKAWDGSVFTATMSIVDAATAPMGAVLNAAKNPIAQGATFLGVSAGLADTVNTYKGFESMMSQVQAISGATGKEFDDLTAKAQEMGATTKFTATEAAQAFNYMAMAGWKPEQMTAGISGIMSLAAASGEDLASTSDIVTDALTAFGLKAKDAGHFSDVLAKVSASSNTNVGMLGESFKYVAPVAGAMKYSVEDTSLALGLMANSSIKGSMAGTALKTSLANMAAPTNSMAEAMDKYGISLTDSSGNMKTLKGVMDNLRSSLGGLSETEQTAAASTIFGKEAMSGMLAIINASEQDYNDLSNAIGNSKDAAQDMADTMLDNLAGSMTLMQSAVEGVQNSFGQRLTPYVRGFVDSITDAMPAVTVALNDFMDTVDKKTAHMKTVIGTMTASDEWQNADMFGKMDIAWDTLIGQPFSDWIGGDGKHLISSGLGTLFSSASAILPGGKKAGLSSVLSSMLIAKGASGIIGNAKNIATTLQPIGNAIKSIGLAAQTAPSVGAFISDLGAMVPTAAKFGLAAAAVTAAVVGIGVAVDNYNQKALSSNLEEHFGNIKLSAQEVQDIASGILDQKYLANVEVALNEVKNADKLREDAQKALESNDVLEFKSRVGIKLTTEEQEEYTSNIETFVKSKIEELESRTFAAHIHVQTYLGGTEEGQTLAQNIEKWATADYVELDGLSSQLSQKVSEALKDGIIDADEEGAISALQEKMNSITARWKESEAQAKWDWINQEYGSLNAADLESGSFTDLLGAMRDQRQSAKESVQADVEQWYSELNSMESAGRITSAQNKQYHKMTGWYVKGQEGNELSKSLQLGSNTLNSAYAERVQGNVQKLNKSTESALENAATQLNAGNLSDGGVAQQLTYGFNTLSTGKGLLGIFGHDSEQNALNTMYESMKPDVTQMQGLIDDYREAGKAIPQSLMDSFNEAIEVGAAAGDESASLQNYANQIWQNGSDELKASLTDPSNPMYETIRSQLPPELTEAIDRAAAETTTDDVTLEGLKASVDGDVDIDKDAWTSKLNEALGDLGETQEVTADHVKIKVDQGDCLWEIGNALGIDWQTIAEQNGIESPYIIHPDQELTISMDTLTAEVDGDKAQAAIEQAMSALDAEGAEMSVTAEGVKVDLADVEVDSDTAAAQIEAALGMESGTLAANGIEVQAGASVTIPSELVTVDTSGMQSATEQAADETETEPIEQEASANVNVTNTTTDTSGMQAQAEEDAQGAVGDVPVEGSANVTFSGTTTDTSGVAEQVTTDLESALTDVPANGHASITLDQSNNAAEIYSLATADVVSAFSETIPADGHVDVTLDQTNNAAAIYSECAGQVQSTFSQGFTASADVAVTLNWHITNPSASISTSSSGSSVSATIAGHASGGEVGLNGAELSWVGEEGLEYIIPTVPARRQRGIELWKSAGRTLGVLGPDDEISAHASGGIVGKEVSNTIPYFDTDSSSQDSEKTEKETVPTNVVSDKSGIVVQVNLSPQFNISDTNDSDVIRLIKAHIKELADDLGSEIATMLSEAYENTPVTT